MNFKVQESTNKLRGGYYTAEAVSRFLSRWALKKHPASILEPSCGDGEFVRAVRAVHDYRLQFTGVEIHPGEAEKARSEAMGARKIKTEIHTCNFLEWYLSKIDAGISFDAVVGNPPYIRYQYLEPKDQDLAKAIFDKHGLAFTKHTNAWVPFIIASVSLLAPGGRIAMVIPSEILHVLHAEPLRKLLLSECQRILLIDPSELLFEEALQGTVLLMAEKKAAPADPSQGVCILPMGDNEFLKQDPELLCANVSYVSGDVLNGKWMKVLLSFEELEVFEKVYHKPTIHRFRNIASVDVGIVTGANKFFLVDDATISKYELEEYARPMFGRSDHCPGIIYDCDAHKANRTRGLPTNFLMIGKIPTSELSDGARKYIQEGEKDGLHKRYKCRIRTPWYSVPSVYTTPIGMLKRAHHFPRLILNSAEAYTTDTAYRIHTTTPTVSAEMLVYSFINSLTALTAELQGRHYGGGVLEMVPSEIEKLSIPLGKMDAIDLRELDRQIRQSISADSILAAQDAIVLKAAGLTKRERETIHEAWRRIRSRRHRSNSEEG